LKDIVKLITIRVIPN